MIVVVDDNHHLSDDSYINFSKEGFATDVLTSTEFDEWIDYVSAQDISAVEAFLFCDANRLEKATDKIRKNSTAPVLALVPAISSLEKKIKLLQDGADDVLNIGVDSREVIARIAAIERRGRGMLRKNQAAKTAGPIEVFNDGRDPRINGVEFTLPRRERRILEYLVANEGARVTKTQLYNAIYGLYETEVEENVIESHISKLRKKLKKIFDEDVIDSKRFLGYMLKISKNHNK